MYKCSTNLVILNLLKRKNQVTCFTSCLLLKSRPQMSQKANIRSSISEEAVLELLHETGLGREQALTPIKYWLEQSSLMLVPNIGQRVNSDEVEATQSAHPSSAFKQSVMTTLERRNRRCIDLSARKGDSDRVFIPLPLSLTTARSVPGHSVFTPLPLPSTTASSAQTGTERAWAHIQIDETPTTPY